MGMCNWDKEIVTLGCNAFKLIIPSARKMHVGKKKCMFKIPNRNHAREPEGGGGPLEFPRYRVVLFKS